MLSPAQLMERLEQIEADLAVRQNVAEAAAESWFLAKRDREKAWAEAFIAAEGSVKLREAIADREVANMGRVEEAGWEASKAVLRVLDTRSMIGQSLLKAHGRAGR